MNAFPSLFFRLLFSLSMIAFLITGSGCFVAYDLIQQFVQGDTETYDITDKTNFPANQPTAHYREVLEEVGAEMGFSIRSEQPEGFVWVVEESNFLEGYFLGKYQGMVISAVLTAATGDDYQLIEGHKALHLSMTSIGNYRSVKREEVKSLFEEVNRRFLAKL